MIAPLLVNPPMTLTSSDVWIASLPILIAPALASEPLTVRIDPPEPPLASMSMVPALLSDWPLAEVAPLSRSNSAPPLMEARLDNSLFCVVLPVIPSEACVPVRVRAPLSVLMRPLAKLSAALPESETLPVRTPADPVPAADAIFSKASAPLPVRLIVPLLIREFAATTDKIAIGVALSPIASVPSASTVSAPAAMTVPPIGLAAWPTSISPSSVTAPRTFTAPGCPDWPTA